ncbi:MAG: hypothetical protein J6P00_00155 [Acetobacter sp.]|nr:hypothetical protein [Acetobacter sp.]
MTLGTPYATVTIKPNETSIIGLCYLQETPFKLLVKAKDLKDILSHGHTARVPLVFFFRDLLNKYKKPLQKDWEVEIESNGRLLLNYGKDKYSFHAFNFNGEKITEKDLQSFVKGEEEVLTSANAKHCNNHFVAVLDDFLLSQTVKFYKIENFDYETFKVDPTNYGFGLGFSLGLH